MIFETEKFTTRVLRGRAAECADFLKIELIKIWLNDINVSIFKNRKNEKHSILVNTPSSGDWQGAIRIPGGRMEMRPVA